MSDSDNFDEFELVALSHPGWAQLLFAVRGLLTREYPDAKVAQVKEKFGGLLIYVDAEPEQYDDINRVVSAAATMSYLTCEQCGHPGHQRPGGWVKTLCDSCHASDSSTAT